MDKKVEDKMVQQIERNLTNHFNESLKVTAEEQPIVSFDYSNPISINRAEYIRQARESCLRQLSEMQSTARAYDSYYLETIPRNPDSVDQKKPKARSLFGDGAGYEGYREADDAMNDENSIRELTAFRFLIIRMVCAIVLFLTVFLVDKFDVKIGVFTPDKIQEYVTGKDTLKELEVKMVAWLKDDD